MYYLRDSNCIILIGGIKLGDLVLSIVEEVFNTVSLSWSVLFERFHCTPLIKDFKKLNPLFCY